MHYRLNAAVHGLGGDPVGHLNRLVVSPSAQEITHLIVHTGGLFGDERVVAVDQVEQAVSDVITLFRTVDDVGQLPVWTDVPVEGSELHHAVWSRPEGEDDATSPPNTTSATLSAILLREGVSVKSSDGVDVGDVETVATGSDATTITFLHVARGLMTRERHLVPISWVSRIGDDVVHLNVTQSTVIDTLTL